MLCKCLTKTPDFSLHQAQLIADGGIQKAGDLQLGLATTSETVKQA